MVMTSHEKALKKPSLRGQLGLQLFALPALAFTVVFCYIPLMGLQIAFRDYKFNMGIWGSPWVGFKHFQAFLTDVNLWPVVLNTVGLSVIKTFVLFPLPIIFALMLNEVRNRRLKSTLQTISYFPYFISWPIVALLASYWLAPSGFINDFLMKLGLIQEPIFFLGQPSAFWGVSIGLDLWKTLGYSSIIYLAAIAGVDFEQIEAAVIDGTNRFQRITHIILPTILPTVSVLMIMNIGNLLSGGLYASNFQISYNLGNNLNYDASNIIDTYVLNTGISYGQFSYATAIGLVNSLVAGVLLLMGNYTSKKLTGDSFF